MRADGGLAVNHFAGNSAEVRGLGMTSQRARDRLIDRLAADPYADRRVLDVMRAMPRHLFIDEAFASRAYEDTALPIGHGQTISQPLVVARMSAALIAGDAPPRKVLEIGTGSGYQCAVLAGLVEEVFTVERIEDLLRKARKCFRKIGLSNIRSKHDDGKLGWPEHGPFDAIMLTAAGLALEPALLEQLAPNGHLIAPIGPPGKQTLVRIRAEQDSYIREDLGAVSFVPLLGGVR